MRRTIARYVYARRECTSEKDCHLVRQQRSVTTVRASAGAPATANMDQLTLNELDESIRALKIGPPQLSAQKTQVIVAHTLSALAKVGRDLLVVASAEDANSHVVRSCVLERVLACDNARTCVRARSMPVSELLLWRAVVCVNTLLCDMNDHTTYSSAVCGMCGVQAGDGLASARAQRCLRQGPG